MQQLPYVTVVWSMITASCLMMAGIHLVAGLSRRGRLAGLAGAAMAVATALASQIEIWMMQAQDVHDYATAARWYHAAVWVLLLMLLVFVRRHLHAGRTWLAWTVAGTRTLSLVLNFASETNLNFRQIDGLHHMPFLGDTVVIASGVPNPLSLIGHFSLLLLVAFSIDAAITVWRRHDAMEKRLLSAAIVFFIVAGSVHSVLSVRGIIHGPVIASVFFMAIVLATVLEAGRAMIRSTQLAERLRENDERVAIAVESGEVGLWEWDILADRLWHSPQWSALLGFPPGVAVTRQQVLAKIHPDDREMLYLAMQRTLNTGDDYNVEFRVPGSQGGMRWIAARGKRSTDARGMPAVMMGSVIDITARRQAAERFAQIVESSPNGILVSDRDRRICLVNAHTEELFGYTREELIGRSVDMLVPYALRDKHAKLQETFFARPIARPMASGLRIAARHKDGTQLTVEIGLAPIPGEAGELHVLAIIADVSERVRRDHEIAQLRNELARISRVTMLGALSGSLAHELNQPLSAILSNAQAALRFLKSDQPDIEELREILTDIAKQDRRAADIIRGLRALLEKGAVQQQTIKLDEVVDEVMSLLRSDLALHHVEAHVECAPGLAQTVGDRVQIQQVILNLVMNGTEAMSDLPPNERRLDVRIAPSADDSIELSIRDAGSGIPEDKLDTVFDAFYTTKRHGMGLGLTVCRTIVAAHGGRLWATNNDGGPGATFHLELKAART